MMRYLFLSIVLFWGCNKTPPSENMKGDSALSSGIQIESIEVSTVDNLSLLCRVWGLLKYYHPSVNKGTLDWDQELFDVLPKIIRAKDNLECNKLLSDWIDSLGSIPDSSSTSVIASPSVLPDFAWFYDTTLICPELSVKLQAISQYTVESSYYVKYVDGFPVFNKENSYENIKFPDIGYQLLSLFRFWNTVEYFYPHRSVLMEDWDAILKTFIPRFIQISSESQYDSVLSDLIVELRDGHAYLYNRHGMCGYDYGNRKVRGIISWIQGEFVVVGFEVSSDTVVNVLQVGDIIVTINNVSVTHLCETRKPHMHGSNEAAVMRNIGYSLLTSYSSIIEVTVLRHDSLVKIYAPTVPVKETDVFAVQNVQLDTCFELLEPDILYINIGMVREEYFANISSTLLASKGIVIDLRGYPQDDLFSGFGDCFFSSRVPFARYSMPLSTSPGAFLFTGIDSIGKNNSHPYDGQIVVIVNEHTQSQAEYLAMALSTLSNSTIIGSHTAGANGNIISFVLPGNRKTQITGIGIYYPDGSPTQEVGVKVDMTIFPTLQGTITGGDELIEKAKELINSH